MRKLVPAYARLAGWACLGFELVWLGACSADGPEGLPRADGSVRQDEGPASSFEGDAGPSEACVQACERFEKQCSMRDESCVILCKVWRDNFPGCDVEFGARYECYATQQQVRFDCAKESFLEQRVAVCKDRETTLGLCHNTDGAPCKAEPALDESCAIGKNRPPHFYFCKEGVEPPEACESYLQPEMPFGYCCP